MQLSEATLLFATVADVIPESTASDEKQNIKKSNVQVCAGRFISCYRNTPPCWSI